MERKIIVQRKELQPTECRDLIQPNEDNHSTHSKGIAVNQKNYVKEILVKSRKQPRERDEMIMGHIIKYLIINQEEHKIHNENER